MAERKFTDLELERSLANDLPPQRARELTERATEADRNRLGELAVEHQAFLAQVDVPDEVRAIERRAARMAPEPPARVRWRWLFSGGALAAAVATVILIVTRRSEPPIDDFQTKGDGVSLIVHAASGSQLKTGDTVQPGTRIRFEINAGRRGYVAVVGFDGTGETTVYYPFGSTLPAAIDPRTDPLLPGAVELDATPGDERFFAVYAEQPFSIASVVPAIRGNAKLPDGVSSSEVVLHKAAK